MSRICWTQVSNNPALTVRLQRQFNILVRLQFASDTKHPSQLCMNTLLIAGEMKCLNIHMLPYASSLTPNRRVAHHVSTYVCIWTYILGQDQKQDEWKGRKRRRAGKRRLQIPLQWNTPRYTWAGERQSAPHATVASQTRTRHVCLQVT